MARKLFISVLGTVYTKKVYIHKEILNPVKQDSSNRQHLS